MLARRKLMGAMAVGAAQVMAPRVSAADKVITFAGWGGTTQDAQKVAWGGPFTDATGIKVIQDGPIDYGKLKAQVESKNVLWDVCDVQSPIAILLGKQGLLEPIDYSIVPRADLDPRFTSDYGVASFSSSFVLGYNKSALHGAVPQNWADVFDTKRFPGKRAFYKWVAGATYEIALLADGVPATELYPYDVDRALAKLQTIKKDIVWWATGAQSQQLLASGETPLGVFWNGRIYALHQEGAAGVELNWYQSTPGTGSLVVPKGCKNKDAAMKFLAIATSARAQAAFANATAYVPINKDAVPFLDKSLLPFMPFGHNETEVKINMAYQAENWEMLTKRWQAWQVAG